MKNTKIFLLGGLAGKAVNVFLSVLTKQTFIYVCVKGLHGLHVDKNNDYGLVVGSHHSKLYSSILDIVSCMHN